MPGLLAVALAEPRQRVADGVHRGADGLGLCLHQVDVFGVAQRLLEQQLVDGRAAAERDLSGKRWRSEQVAECAADRLNAAGLVGADLTVPNTKVLCAWNAAAVSPLFVSSLPTRCGGAFGPERVFGQALSKAGYSSTSLIKAWFQGENDSFASANGLSYEQNLKNLIADVRSDAGSPTLPVVIVQTGGWAQSLPFGKNVAAAQKAVVDAGRYARLVNTSDLSKFYHCDPAAQLIIRDRIALAVKALLAAATAPG